jgi:hypothetical protein
MMKQVFDAIVFANGTTLAGRQQVCGYILCENQCQVPGDKK